MSEEKQQYDPPQVEQMPTDAGPGATAAGTTTGDSDEGPEWRPSEEES